MVTARTGATATLLADGRLLILGGTDGSGVPLVSAELYDPKTATFRGTGSMSTPRFRYTATLLNDGRVLVVGGDTGAVSMEATANTSLASAELYDPAKGTFVGTGSMSVGRAFHSATLLADGRVLIAGGHGSLAMSSTEIFDPATGKFSPGDSMSVARVEQTATLLHDGRVLIAGGMDGQGMALRSAELFDPTTGAFAPTGAMSTERQCATLLPDGRVLMTGSPGSTTSAEIYEPASGRFAQTGSMSTPRYVEEAASLADGRVLITGGLAPAELFDPRSGSFVPAQPASAVRVGSAVAALSDGRVLIAGGGDGNGHVLASAELYDPAPETATPPSPGPTPAGAFALSGVMNAPRANASTATLLADGRVLIAGGVDRSGKGLAAAEIFDPRTGEFKVTGSMTMPRGGHTATLLTDGHVLITGGATIPNYGGPPPVALASAELYDPATGKFSPTGSMATQREFHTATLLPDGRVLIAGGLAYQSSLASAELYDPKTGRFSPTGSMITGRGLHSATLLSDGRVLVAGGQASCQAGCQGSASAELWDPATGKFSPTGSMTVGREYQTATLLRDGRVLLAGGSGLASAELFDPSLGQFSPTGSMSAVRDMASATLLPNGNVLVAGGAGDASADLFDPATDRFVPTTFMVSVRFGQTATMLATGQVLIAGGNSVGPADNVGALDTAELYQPALAAAPSASPLPSAGSGPGETPMPGDAAKASALVDAYEHALVAGKWRQAFDMLSAADQAGWLGGDRMEIPPAMRAEWGSLAPYVYERSAYFHSVAGRYTLSIPTHDAATLAFWTSGMGIAAGADLGRGFIIRADYPALAGNNAGWEMFLAAPDTNGDWRIWNVR
jgi:large repetitive protein